ncbi:S8 family serine peptidase [Streptomyces sp. NPDC051018]|uniref:S8 family serine peptidase n=1 Tax=Streptomyces sp. NPDC051018 TaxID=3365639 RepID=UPI0037B63DFD
MRRQVKKACATSIAAACAVALTAGMTGPASSAADTAQGRAGAGKAAPGLTPQHRITLITGDRVLVDAKGRPTGFERAKGREHIPMTTRTVRGHTYVVPLDAQRLIASGRVDRRLFDVTALSRAESRRAYRAGLKVIVGYQGSAGKSARAGVRSADGTEVRRSLPSLNADAVTASAGTPGTLWEAVTRSGSGGSLTAESGIRRIWLDGVRKAGLDRSTAQIGAPALWSTGLTGAGVKIAVLDTGIDATHPDLAGRVAGAQNFSAAPDSKDRVGHGTHVASIAAGSGTKSGGKFKGVAPGATLLNGKVLDDDGYGEDSGILAGIDWAVAQGAHVVNLSLGGLDTPELDPLEAQINKLTAEKGVLFAVAAGNSGPAPGTVDSPGSAEAALTVGAVDGQERLADFSSRGPRTGDGGIKPDVTAPGVDITAASAPGSQIAREVGESPAGYLTISGTSMATPHAAGAAALLKEKHPTWRAAELKGVLTGSAKDGGHTAHQQGSGRIAADRAVAQAVVAEPVSLSYGTQRWPHGDDTPVTKTLTYRNLGTTDVTLDLSVTGTDPAGRPAPAGFFTADAPRITVPAGSTASVGVTADTRPGGTSDGHYSGVVTATGTGAAAGQAVRTALSVEREAESYDLTLDHIARDGTPGKTFETALFALTGAAAGELIVPDVSSGTATVRVPKGRYLLDTYGVVDPDNLAKGVDVLVQPRLDIAGNTTVTLDARTARPVGIGVPDAKARPTDATMSYLVGSEEDGVGSALTLGSFAQFRTAHLGPRITDGSLYQAFAGRWDRGATAIEYNTVHGGRVQQVPTGFTKSYRTAELAAVKVDFGASVTGKKGGVRAVGWAPGAALPAFHDFTPQVAPGSRSVWVSAVGGSRWELEFSQLSGVDPHGTPMAETIHYFDSPKAYVAGKRYTEVFNRGVFGPRLSSRLGVYRQGNLLWGAIPVFADGPGHAGWSDATSVRTTLHRAGKKIGENEDPLSGSLPFTVPAGNASYVLATSAVRSPKLASVSSRVDASWTFTSRTNGALVKLPVSTARFGAAVGFDGTVPAGRTQTFPLLIQGAAAGGNLKTLVVYSSYDQGRTWKQIAVKNSTLTVKNPAKGQGIAFRAYITDKQGNKGVVSIYNAYRGK